jgi:hypothetical protein
MKLLLVFALLALICMARSAPAVNLVENFRFFKIILFVLINSHQQHHENLFYLTIMKPMRIQNMMEIKFMMMKLM